MTRWAGQSVAASVVRSTSQSAARCCLSVAVPPRFLAFWSIRARLLAALPAGRRIRSRRPGCQLPPGPGSSTGRSSRSGRPGRRSTPFRVTRAPPGSRTALLLSP